MVTVGQSTAVSVSIVELPRRLYRNTTATVSGGTAHLILFGMIAILIIQLGKMDKPSYRFMMVISYLIAFDNNGCSDTTACYTLLSGPAI